MITEDQAAIAAMKLHETRRSQVFEAGLVVPLQWNDILDAHRKIYTETMKDLLEDFEDGWLESV